MSEAEAMVPAKKALTEGLAEAVREYLAFGIAGETYALPLSCVREIVRVPDVTEVPRAPEAVLGIISVRGAVTTVLDLRVKLRLPVSPISPHSRILLVEGGGEVMGLLVDAVSHVYRLREQEVELATVLGSTAPSYLVGIGRPGTAGEEGKREDAQPEAGEMLLLLDPIALLKA